MLESMQASPTVAHALAAKRKLEQVILAAVQSFEQEIGLTVNRIDTSIDHRLGRDSETVKVDVEVTL